ncbi:EAL domain-containing response regulator [Sulfurospirillum barnesii]|uniref:EAL domain-containing protein n=1 Tax=Sulfurospirillum barnesii (strain ATCC 700032 / DSM 10660 / SES-3) TaxID=760154 RepID=I3XWG9_SULBS|nr:EAL domain-containing protein [Sulfurospirillum barnesii]AFL68293.1 EAL domain-containing protein [Sulfurospirillum barnesii SES-3]
MTECAIKSLKESCKNLKILYVEDDKVAQQYTHSLLRDFFEHMDVVSTGECAYDLFVDAKITIPSLDAPTHEFSYDLVIVDLKLPKMSGLSLIAKMRKICKETAIIVTSAFSEEEYFLESIRLGVNGYVLKPLDFDKFLETLHRSVEAIMLKKAHETYVYQLKQTLELHENALQEQSYNDMLTKLPNKKSLEEHLTRLLPLDIPSLLLIQMDHFHHYMKLYGTQVCYSIVQTFAKALYAHAHKQGYLAFQISPHEFALLDVKPYIDSEKVYEDITQLLRVLDDYEMMVETVAKKVLVRITIGVTFDQENIFQKAYTALDFAKEMGKKFVVYTNNLDETSSLNNDFYWQEVIADTLDNDDLVPFFQPIVNAKGEVIKYEALMRLKAKDEQGEDVYVSPASFLDLSKRTKQYDALSYKMIEKVVEKMFAYPNVIFSINLSERDILNKNIRYFLRQKLSEFKAKHGCITLMFEILESESGMNVEMIRHFLNEIRYEYAPIAIDDFGTGYSNFAQLLHLSPTHLKIDGSLIRYMDSDEKVCQLVQGIVSFAHSLHVETIAEYVHNENIFKQLSAMGVDGFQGYFVGEPSMELVC